MKVQQDFSSEIVSATYKFFIRGTTIHFHYHHDHYYFPTEFFCGSASKKILLRGRMECSQYLRNILSLLSANEKNIIRCKKDEERNFSLLNFVFGVVIKNEKF